MPSRDARNAALIFYYTSCYVLDVGCHLISTKFLCFEFFVRILDDVEHFICDEALGHVASGLRNLVRMDNHERLVIALLDAVRGHERAHGWVDVAMAVPQHFGEVREQGTNVILILLGPFVDVGADEILEHLSLVLF